MPITDCPSAPGQGALAVECRSNDDAVRSLLGTLNDVLTAHYVGEERRVLAQFGGGCHQQFGATCVEHPNCGALLYVKGRAANGEVLDRVEWLAMPPAPAGRVTAWDGFLARESKDTSALNESAEVLAAFRRSSAPVFIAHSRALPGGVESELDGRRVWTSGTASWFRLAERGVRFVELIDNGSSNNWDSHDDIAAHAPLAKKIDQPIAGLLQDLKRRGMFDDTLVVWTTEFGRTPGQDGAKGRGHHPAVYSSWLAGGGIKGGIVHGETDDFSYNVTEKPVHIHDLNATILHCMGINHERLTYRFQGRDFRLTDVAGNVVKAVLA